MNKQEAEQVYLRLFIAFPQLRDWLASTKHAAATHDVWCGVLAGVDHADAMSVVDAMIRGDEPMPEAYERERTPQMIRSAAAKMRSERNHRDRMNSLHITATAAKTTNERFAVAMREARRLGEAVREGKLTKSANNLMVNELVEWSERNGQVPEFIS